MRGGTGKHYASSLKKGGEIILYISENLGDKYKVVDILVDRDYIWHINGLPINTSDLVNKVDIVWNTSHPSFSNILDSLLIPNIGVSSFFYAQEDSKDILREHIKKIGIHMPRRVVAPKNAQEVFKKFGAPWIVKINNEIKMAQTFNELAELINNQENLIVEEFIAGKIASVHSVRGFRKHLPAQAGDIYTFPLGNPYGIFSGEEKEKLNTLAKDLHKHINSKHYLKSDFVMNPRGKIYLLQIDEIPNLKQGLHFEEVCESVGAKMHHVVEHVLEQAT